MNVICEEIFLLELGEKFTYYLSCDLREIERAISEKTGIALHGIAPGDFKENTQLAVETKNLMQKHRAKYSATFYNVDYDCVEIIINCQLKDKFFIYLGIGFDRFVSRDRVKAIFKEFASTEA
jgi:hypothetical protein